MQQTSCQTDPPSDPAILLVQAKTLLQEARCDDALALCEQVLAGTPDSAQALMLAGDALVALQRYRDAADRYRQAIQLNPPELELLRQKLDEAIDLSLNAPPSLPTQAPELTSTPAPSTEPAPPKSAADSTLLPRRVSIAEPVLPSRNPPPNPELDSPLARLATPGRARLLIVLALLAIILSILFSLRPWEKKYVAPAPSRTIVLPVTPDEPLDEEESVGP